MPQLLHALDASKNLNGLLDKLKFEWFANPIEGASPITGADMRAKLFEALQFVADRHPQIAAEADHLRRIINKLPDTENLPAYRGGSINKEALKLRFFTYLLFARVEQNPITFAALRDSFPAPKEKRRNVVKSYDDTPIGPDFLRFGDDPIRLARGKRGFVFRTFTSLPNWNPADSSEPQWKEFDIAAFKEALKTLHQIDAKGAERKAEQKRLQARHNFMRRKTETWHGGESDEAEPDVLEGDPRIRRLEELLSGELATEYEMTEGKKVEYGLRPRTIRGFRDLRKEWRKAVKPSETFCQERKDELLSKLRAYQKENPQIVGSVRLFEELLERDNWVIWQEPDAITAAEWAARGFADDPLEALTRERELLEDIQRLGEPVRLTPADPVYSRRQFYFSDVCKFTERGDYKHEANKRAVVVPLALKSNGHWKRGRVRLCYSAPRLLREHLRADAGENLAAAPWSQPMMEAVAPELAQPQDFRDAPVALMPDELPSGDRRFLLNFPLTLDAAPLVAALGKAAKWNGQFARFDNQLFYLRWPADKWPDRSPTERWYQDMDSFTCLATDLGQRDAAAFALVEARAGQPFTTVSRFIGAAEGRKWHASVRTMGLLRLPGEDARVWRDNKYCEEFYGERGRSWNEAEWREAQQICQILGFDEDATGTVVGDNSREYSFPELNDRLLFALRRAQTRLARLQSWSWMLFDEQRREKVLSAIQESDEDPFGLKPLVENGTDVLTGKLAFAISQYRQGITTALVKIANRVLPLRGRRWEWVLRKDDSGCHMLRQTEPGTDTRSKKLQGQRGLSFERIEQLEELRQRCQSLNRVLLQTPGQRAGLGAPKRGIELPDPCPDLLEKMDELREQRVNQTAHLILAEALGIRLRPPQKDQALRIRYDVHGEYERILDRQPVDFIVLEDLSRYLSSQGRARSENSRLMKWCHRAVLKKLKELCEPYGIPVLETPAAWSSRFASRNGVPGFRAAELTPDARNKYHWRKHLDRLAAAARGEIKLNREERVQSNRVRQLFALLENINADLLKNRPSRPKWRTLLAPQVGGPIFVPMRGPLMQADINAAINLALRAIASPTCHDIHVRIRSERDGDGWRVRRDNQREKARWSEPAPSVRFLNEKDAASLTSERNPNFFPDPARIAVFDRCEIAGITVASSRGLWGAIRQREWQRVNQLNYERLKKWGFTPSLDEDGTLDDEDNIQL